MSGLVGVDREELLAACESRAADGYPDLSLELVEIRALLAELEQAETKIAEKEDEFLTVLGASAAAEVRAEEAEKERDEMRRAAPDADVAYWQDRALDHATALTDARRITAYLEARLAKVPALVEALKEAEVELRVRAINTNAAGQILPPYTADSVLSLADELAAALATWDAE